MIQKATLLYVEDDEIIRESFSEIFKAYFEKVITTDNGNEALELYKKNKIDIAILDISINGINGLSVAQKIREQSNDTMILITSAHSEKEKLLQAVNLGLTGYLVKPIKHNELINAINTIVDKLPKSLMKLEHDYTWDNVQCDLFYKGNLIKLTKNESMIVNLLILNKNSYITSCYIEDELFEKKDIADIHCNNIVQLISRLKKKILKLNDKAEYFIENGYGIGYRIIVV